MKSKPIIMEHFSTTHTSYKVNFTFTTNITILTGDSATGKTAVFSFIKECVPLNSNLLCINYLDYQKDIKELLDAENLQAKKIATELNIPLITHKMNFDESDFEQIISVIKGSDT